MWSNICGEEGSCYCFVKWTWEPVKLPSRPLHSRSFSWSSFFSQQLSVTTETLNWPIYRDLVTVECSATKGHIILPLHGSGTIIMMEQKEFKSRKKGGNMVWNTDFKKWYGYCILELMSTVISYTGTPQDWACQSWKGERLMGTTPPENLYTDNSLWGRRDIFSFFPQIMFIYISFHI